MSSNCTGRTRCAGRRRTRAARPAHRSRTRPPTGAVVTATSTGQTSTADRAGPLQRIMLLTACLALAGGAVRHRRPHAARCPHGPGPAVGAVGGRLRRSARRWSCTCSGKREAHTFSVGDLVARRRPVPGRPARPGDRPGASAPALTLLLHRRSAASSSPSTWPSTRSAAPSPRRLRLPVRRRRSAAGTGWPHCVGDPHHHRGRRPVHLRRHQPLRGARGPAAARGDAGAVAAVHRWARPALGLVLARTAVERPGGAGAAGPAHDPHRRRLPRLHPRPGAAGEPAPAARRHLAAARRRHPGGARRLPRLGALGLPRRAGRARAARSGRPRRRDRQPQPRGRRAGRHGPARRPRGPPPAAAPGHRLRRADHPHRLRPRRSSWTRYAAGRGLKDAMAAALRTEDRVHGLLLVGGRHRRRHRPSPRATSRCWTPSPGTWPPRWSAAAWRRTSARSPTSRSSCATRRCTTR